MARSDKNKEQETDTIQAIFLKLEQNPRQGISDKDHIQATQALKSALSGIEVQRKKALDDLNSHAAGFDGYITKPGDATIFLTNFFSANLAQTINKTENIRALNPRIQSSLCQALSTTKTPLPPLSITEQTKYIESLNGQSLQDRQSELLGHYQIHNLPNNNNNNNNPTIIAELQTIERYKQTQAVAYLNQQQGSDGAVKKALLQEVTRLQNTRDEKAQLKATRILDQVYNHSQQQNLTLVQALNDGTHPLNQAIGRPQTAGSTSSRALNNITTVVKAESKKNPRILNSVQQEATEAKLNEFAKSNNPPSPMSKALLTEIERLRGKGPEGITKAQSILDGVAAVPDLDQKRDWTLIIAVQNNDSNLARALKTSRNEDGQSKALHNMQYAARDTTLLYMQQSKSIVDQTLAAEVRRLRKEDNSPNSKANQILDAAAKTMQNNIKIVDDMDNQQSSLYKAIARSQRDDGKSRTLTTVTRAMTQEQLATASDKPIQQALAAQVSQLQAKKQYAHANRILDAAKDSGNLYSDIFDDKSDLYKALNSSTMFYGKSPELQAMIAAAHKNPPQAAIATLRTMPDSSATIVTNPNMMNRK